MSKYLQCVSYRVIHSYFPAWHSRPVLLSTKWSPVPFPTQCLHRPVLAQLGSLPFSEYAPRFPVLLLLVSQMPSPQLFDGNSAASFRDCFKCFSPQKESICSYRKGEIFFLQITKILFLGIYHSYFCTLYFPTYKTGPEREETRSFPAEFSILSSTGSRS